MQLAFSGVQELLWPVRRLTARTRRRAGRATLGPIGLELSDEKLHMIQLEHGAAGPAIRAAVSIDYPGDREALLRDPRKLRRFIGEARSGRPFKGRHAVTCVPPEDLKLALINYRVNDDGDELTPVMQQAMERIEGAPEDWVVDYVPVATRNHDDGERAALLALARRDRVETRLALLRAAELDVDALEIGPVAIRRLVTTMRRNRESFESVLVVNFGREKSYLTVLSGRRLILDRDISFGEARLTEKLARGLEVEPGEARALLSRYGVASRAGSEAAGEITQTIAEILRPELRHLTEEAGKVLVYLASQTRGASVDLVYLLGSVARWPGADRLLNDMLALPVEVLDPFSTFATREGAFVRGTLDPIAGIAVATGCALRGQPDHG